MMKGFELSDDQLVLCGLCGELLSVGDAVYHKGFLYHKLCLERMVKGKRSFNDLMR